MIHGESKTDFCDKLYIALKEANVTLCKIWGLLELEPFEVAFLMCSEVEPTKRIGIDDRNQKQ